MKSGDGEVKSRIDNEKLKDICIGSHSLCRIINGALESELVSSV